MVIMSKNKADRLRSEHSELNLNWDDAMEFFYGVKTLCPGLMDEDAYIEYITAAEERKNNA